MHNQNLQVIYQSFGDPKKVLELHSNHIKPLSANEVLVKMRVSPINPSDLIPIWGNYSHRVALPQVAGYEGVGEVIAVGENVSRVLIGQRVLPLRGQGTWQQYLSISEDYLVPVPNEMDDMTAAQLYINPFTAWVILHYQFSIKVGDILLINAANSAIGQFFAQLTHLLGIRMIAVVRHSIHVEPLKALGAWQVIDTSKENLFERVQEYTFHRGAQFAIDLIGGNDGTQLAKCVGSQGEFMVLGLLSGDQVDWQTIYRTYQIQSQMFHLRIWNQKVTLDKWHDAFQTMLNVMLKHHFVLPQSGAIPHSGAVSHDGTLFHISEIQQALYADMNRAHPLVNGSGKGRGQGKIFIYF